MSDVPAIWCRDLTVTYRRLRRPVSGLKDFAIRAVQRRLQYERLTALRDVSFRVHRGEVLGVLGANGAGKTTLLKVLGQVLPPTRGRVIVRGFVAPMIELGAGFESELSARDNVVLYGSLLGRDPAGLRSRAEEIVDWAGVRDFIDEPLRTYSSGMLARLAFAIAIDCDPDIVLIDEVLAVGDADFQVRSRERIDALLSRGAAVVIVSHASAVLESIADRILWLDRGVVQACGAPGVIVRGYHRAVAERTVGLGAA